MRPFISFAFAFAFASLATSASRRASADTEVVYASPRAVETTPSRILYVAPGAPDPANTPPAPPPAVADATEPPAPRKHVNPQGFVFALSTALAIPTGTAGGSLAMSDIGFGAGFGLHLGAYPTKHFGLVAGLDAAEHQPSGCNGAAPCTAVTFAVPLIAEFALKDRSEGLYFQVGVDAFEGLVIAVPDAGATISGVFHGGRLGVGYRIAARSLGAIDSSLSADLFASMEAGEYTTTDSGEIADQAIHEITQVGLRFHWAP